MSSAPARPEFDPTIWRVVGDPLVPATVAGPLHGETVAVKDLFEVIGQRVGAGVPAFLDSSPVAHRNAAAVQLLLDAGAAISGIARTDQFAYSIAGTNEHYGAPVNPAAPGAVPGGSSSGPATAVSLDLASIGLGTDTAGSIRVPASYQGLWGLRTSHGAVPVTGLLALAPDFDTVGLLARTPDLLARSAAVLVPDATVAVGGLVVDPDIVARADTGTAAAVAGAVDRLGATPGVSSSGTVGTVALGGLGRRYQSFRVHQAFQAWAVHGAWISAHPGAVIGAAAGRFEAASQVSATDDAEARRQLTIATAEWNAVLGNDVLLLPTASSAPPRLSDPESTVDRIRAATLEITCLAAITGRPAVSIPGLRTDSGPVGLCLVGPVGSDRSLVDLAARVATILTA